MTACDQAADETSRDWEHLSTPERSAPGWRGSWPWGALAVLGVVAVVGLGLRWSQSVESTARAELARVLAQSERVAQAGERAVQSALADASPAIWSSSVPEGVRAGLRGLVQASAADVVAELASLRPPAEDVLVLPWQDSMAQARQSVTDLLDAQSRRFAGIAADARDIDRVLADGPIPSGPAQAALARASAG